MLARAAEDPAACSLEVLTGFFPEHSNRVYRCQTEGVAIATERAKAGLLCRASLCALAQRERILLAGILSVTRPKNRARSACGIILRLLGA